MAILTISNFIGSNYLVYGGSAVIGLFVVIGILISIRNRNAEIGPWEERREEEEMGMRPWGRAQRQVIKDERSEAGIEGQEVEAEKAEEGPAKGNPSQMAAVAAVEEGARAAQHEEKAEVAAGAMEGRMMGIVASTKAVVRATIEFNARKKDIESKEEYTAAILDQIMNKIKNTRNYGVIDSRMVDYLGKLWENIVKISSFDVSEEEKKVRFLGNLVEKLQVAVKVMKDDIKYAGIQLKRLRKEGRKTWKHFRKELKDLKRSINSKVKELKRLRKIDSSPQSIANLENEIRLLSKQFASADALISQLEATYAFIRKEVREMKRILRYVLSNEKQMAAYEKMLNNRRKAIANRVRDLEKVLHAIQDVEKLFQKQNSNPHEIALVLSGQIAAYFKTYGSIVENDIGFDDAIKGITVKNYVIARQIDAFEKLELAMTESEMAIGNGVEAMTQLLGGIVGDQSKIRVEEIIKALKSAGQDLKYEQDIENYVKNLTDAIARNSKSMAAEIDGIIAEDKKILDNIKIKEQSHSAGIGDSMGTAVQRKVSIGEMQISQADAFGRQLKERNESAARAYEQARRAESFAAAA